MNHFESHKCKKYQMGIKKYENCKKKVSKNATNIKKWKKVAVSKINPKNLEKKSTIT